MSANTTQQVTIDTILTAGLAATGALVPGGPVTVVGLATAGVLLKEGAKRLTEWSEQGKLNAELELLRQEEQSAALLNEAFRALGIRPSNHEILLTQQLDLTRIIAAEVTELTAEFQQRRAIAGLLVPGTEKMLGEPRPAELLRANHEVVPFFGRADDLALLDSWHQSNEPIGVILFAGPGGAGKTRLLLHWCGQLRERGHIAGFLPDSLDKTDLDPIFMDRGRLVVVVDYAETRLDLVAELLDRAGQAWEEGLSLQLVLLARRIGDWWDQLRDKTARVRQIVTKAGYAGELPKLLPAPPQREELFRRSIEHFAERLGCALPAGPIPTLVDDEFAHPLYVQMAALAVLDGRPVTDPANLLEETLVHEQSYWDKAIDAVGFDNTLIPDVRKIVDRVSTLLTLWGGVQDRVRVQDLIAATALLPEGQSHLVRRVEEDIFWKLYGRTAGSEDRVSGVEPDLLGEQLVTQQLHKSPAFLGTVFEDASDEQGARGLTVLTRLSKRDPKAREWLHDVLAAALDRWASIALKVAIETGDPIGQVLADVLEQSPRPELATTLAKEVPGRTIALRRFAIVATEQALEWLTGKEEVDHADLARLKNNLGNRYTALGRREEALDASKEAVEIRRALAEARPDAFRPDLASALNNLGNRYSDLGRREEALDATKEAVEILAPYFMRLPQAFLQSMETMAGNYVARCSDLGVEPDHELLGPINSVFAQLAEEKEREQ